MAGEKHFSAAEIANEKKRRRRRRKIILAVVFLLMAAAAVAEIAVLKSMTSVDRRFLRGVERGVAGGWESSIADLQLREQGCITDTTFIDTELEAVGEFNSKVYQDKALKKLAKRYISDLKKCRSAVAAHNTETDSDAFWNEFAEPYTDRLIVLRKLYVGDYKIGDGWEAYPEMLDELMSRAWAAEKMLQLEFTRTGTKNGMGEFKATLQNDSGYDIEFLNIDIEIYDSNDALAGTAEVYMEDIADGSSTELVFYYSDNKVSSYRITAIDLEAAPRPEITEEEQE